MEDNLDGRQPQWKMASIDDGLNFYIWFHIQLLCVPNIIITEQSEQMLHVSSRWDLSTLRNKLILLNRTKKNTVNSVYNNKY